MLYALVIIWINGTVKYKTFKKRRLDLHFIVLEHVLVEEYTSTPLSPLFMASYIYLLCLQSNRHIQYSILI